MNLSALPSLARPVVEQAAAVYLTHTTPWLVGLILHGSALKGDFIPGCSDIDFQLFLEEPAFEYGDQLRLDICLAIQRDLARIDLSPFNYIQGYAFPGRMREGWVGPPPGAYHVLAGRLPIPEATADQLLQSAAAALNSLSPVPGHIPNGLLDHGEHRLERHVRLLVTEVWPVLKQVAAIRENDPIRVWSLTKEEVIALLPADAPMGSAIRAFYGALMTYYPAQASVDDALAVVEHGVGFLRAAKSWWESERER